MKPVHIFVGGQELIGYTGMTLSRNKNELTGQLSVDLFMGYLPNKPVLDSVLRGKDILVYIGGHLVFSGVIDRREDLSERTSTLSLGPSNYSVSFQCRGKTSVLIDSSHQDETGTMKEPTNREVAERLLEPWGLELDWVADVLPLNRFRFRDGARVVDELQRLAELCSLYMYETRDGKLKVLDKKDTLTGEPIILGQNILSFRTEQSGDQERTEVLVKGQRNDNDVWGADAVLKTMARIRDGSGIGFSPITVQLFGNATDDLIDRRARYEMNKRTSEGKQISVEVFHVQQRSGEPWEIGSIHYVEIPPAGVFGQFEVIGLEHKASGDELTTTVKLAPPPTEDAPASAGMSPLDSLPELPDDGVAGIAARISKYGASELVTSWAKPTLSGVDAIFKLLDVGNQLLMDVSDKSNLPRLTLPPGFKGADE